MTGTEKIKIPCFGIKQYNAKNNLEVFLPSKLKDYSFLVGKIKLKELLTISTSTMLQEFYSFNSIDNNIINKQNISNIKDENLRKGLKNFLDNYNNKIADIDVLEQLKLGEEFEEDNTFLNIIPQRLTDETRLSEIWQYLKYNDYPFFPNSFICALNLDDSNISEIPITDSTEKIFNIIIDPNPASVFVIDGQHRLYGSLIKKDEALKQESNIEIDNDSIVQIGGVDYVLANKDMEVIVVLMVNTPIELQASLFQIINFKTQRIRSSLYFDLFNFPINDLSEDELAHSIVLNFYLKDKDIKKSAGYLIHLSEFYKKESKKLYLSQGTFAKKIQEYFLLGELFYFYINRGIRSKLFTNDEVKKYYTEKQIEYYNKAGTTYTNFMYDYFAALKKGYGNIDKKTNEIPWESDNYQIMKSTGVGVFMNLMCIFYGLDFIQKGADFSSFMNYNSFGNDENINKIFNNIGLVFEQFKFDKETLKSSAGFGIQGKLTTDIINYLYKNNKLKDLLEKENYLKCFIQDEELKEISCKDKIFNTKLRRYLKNKINDENNFQGDINTFIPDIEYHASSLLIIIGYIYYNINK